MLTHKGGYLKYWYDDWKGKRAGRYDAAKECRHIVPTRTKWKGSKAKKIGGGCKIFYNGADGRKNGIGIAMREKLAESVLEVKRVSDRLMAMKLEVNGSILNIVSAYAPQVNNSMEEKNNFWEDLDGLIESISKEERIVLGADLNGHVGEGNIGDEEIMGRYGAGTRNKEGSMVVVLGKGWIWQLSILISRRKMNKG